MFSQIVSLSSQTNNPDNSAWTMEEKLIVAVCSHAELYDTRCFNYRNKNVKEQAWRSISEELGWPTEQCKKRWKTLRDVYLRERRKEADRRIGSAATPFKRWRYTAILGFLDPFLSTLETNGSLEVIVGDDYGSLGGDEAAAAESLEGEATSLDFGDGSEPNSPVESYLPGLVHVAASSTAQVDKLSSSTPGAADSRKKRRLCHEDSLGFEKDILQALRASPHLLPVSTTDCFVKSLVPMIDSLTSEKREKLKFEMYKMVYEATQRE